MAILEGDCLQLPPERGTELGMAAAELGSLCFGVSGGQSRASRTMLDRFVRRWPLECQMGRRGSK